MPSKSKLVIDQDKYKYIFGTASESEHTIARTAHNAAQMACLGISDSAEGRLILEKHFKTIVKDLSTVIKQYSNKFGDFEIRESILAGPSGKFAKLESSFQVFPDGSRRLISIIPKGGS